MQTTLGNALLNTLATITPVPANGGTGQQASSAGTPNASDLNGPTSTITGQVETLLRADAKPTGQQLFVVTAVEIPKTADEAAVLAEQLVGTLLPQSLTLWLEGEEYYLANGMHKMVPGTGAPASKPEMTPELMEIVSSRVKSLTELLVPARLRGAELEMEVAKLFAVFNVFTGDEGKTKLQVSAWADDLEGYPLYAVRKAARWARRGESKMPSLSDFIRDVKLAVGDKVLSRKRMLEQMMNQNGASDA